MRVILHAGMHKTGTTSIQQNLLANTEILSRYGYGVLVNKPQFLVKNEALFDSGWISETLNSIRDKGIENLIVSAESFSRLDCDQLNTLLSAFGNEPAHFVVFFRHWSAFLPSRWQQNCRRSDSRSFPGFLDAVIANADRLCEARFDLVARAMVASNAASVALLSYDNAVSADGLLPAFAGACGFPPALTERLLATDIARNKAMPVRTVDYIRLFNAVVADRLGAARDSHFEAQLNRRPNPLSLYQGGKVMGLLQANADLKSRLDEKLDEYETTVPLPRDRPEFMRWERLLEQEFSDRLLNPVNGSFFGSAPDREFRCSALEFDQIPADLVARMAECLDKEIPGEN